MRLPQQVMERHLIRMAAQTVLPRNIRLASGMNAQILEGIGSALFQPGLQQNSRTAFLSLVTRFKQILTFMGKYPKVWAQVKEALGVASLTDLPSKLKALAQQGLKILHGALDKAFSHMPLKIYTMDKGKLDLVNDFMKQIHKAFPVLDRILDKIQPAVNQLDIWLRKNLPVIGKGLVIAVYCWIWINVTEFEWDVKSILDAVTGRIGLADLMGSLPGSTVGFLMNGLGFGTFTLLPAAFAARTLWLVMNRYLNIEGHSLVIDWKAIQEDFPSVQHNPA